MCAARSGESHVPRGGAIPSENSSGPPIAGENQIFIDFLDDYDTTDVNLLSEIGEFVASAVCLLSVTGDSSCLLL